MPALPPELAARLPDNVSVEIANLSPEGQTQVIEALTHAQDAGGLDDAQADASLAAAQTADEHRETVADLQRQEAEAVATGDRDAAAQHAQDIVWELKAVDAAGGEVDGQMIQAEQDLSHQDQALADSEASHDLVDMAANAGSAESAATALDSAANYAEASADQTAATDHTQDAVTPAEDAGAA